MTDATRLTLVAVEAASARLGYSPTVREVGAARRPRACAATVHRHLGLLQEDGLVSWRPGAARTLQVTAAGREALA